MKKNYPIIIGLSSYIPALLIVLHWMLICSFDEFLHLHKKGFSLQTLNGLPLFLQPLYKGIPNLITLISFMLFTFSAFALLEQKKKIYRYLSLSAFVMIAYLFLFLIKF